MGMTINPRGRGFEVYVRAAGPDGNSQKIRRTLPTYEEAERYGHSAMSSILAGRSIPKPKEVVKVKPKTLGEVTEFTIQERWEKRCKSEKGLNLQIAQARECLDVLGPETPLISVNTEDLETLKSALAATGISYKSVNRKLTTFSTILRTAFKKGWLSAMPYIPMYPEDSRTDRRLRYATKEEVEQMVKLMLEAGNRSLSEFVEVLYGTGMRTGELLSLKDTKINLGKIELGVFKGGNERTLPMTARVAEILEARKGHQSGLLFFDVSQTHLNRVWKKQKAKMGLADDKEFVPHAIRHYVGTRLAQKNIHKSVISTWMGHRNESTTDIYIRTSGRDLEGIEEVLG